MSKKQITRRSLMETGVTALAASSLLASRSDAAAKKPLVENVRFGLNLLVYTATFSKDKIDLIQKVADMGYDGVEIPFNDLEILDPRATALAREKAGVGLTSCCVLIPGTSITSTDSAERKIGIERLRRMVEITAEMGGDTVAGPLYAPVRELTGRARTADEWKWGVEGLRDAAEHAGKAHVVLAVEPLNRFETHFLNTTEDAIKLVKAVDHPNIKVQIDTFHANIEEKNTPAAIRAAGPLLGHFHASESDRGVPGTGQVPWEDCFSALRDIDYKGWITIESFATGIVDLCAAACVWRPIYESADDLAVNGLAFLKTMARTA
jgi:D-psicose/D-tagatose/L-ribulose 3-epimerase